MKSFNSLFIGPEARGVANFVTLDFGPGFAKTVMNCRAHGNLIVLTIGTHWMKQMQRAHC
jgi:hypothetical protein